MNKQKIEDLINSVLNNYEFELYKDEYSVVASELAEKIVKLFVISDTSVRFFDPVSAGKYLKEVSSDTDFWFPVHSFDIIHHANDVWNEINIQ